MITFSEDVLGIVSLAFGGGAFFVGGWLHCWWNWQSFTSFSFPILGTVGQALPCLGRCLLALRILLGWQGQASEAVWGRQGRVFEAAKHSDINLEWKFDVEQLSGQVPPGVELQVGLLPLGPWGEEDGGRPGVNKEVRRPNIFSPRVNTVLSIGLFGA